ncbi:32126_t:CDS:2, partial [Racocetra persica]
FASKNDHGESFEAWVNQIYSSEDVDTSNDTSLKDSNTIEYLLSVDCSGLLEKAHAAIFLSIDELWSTSNEIGLKASILDSRIIKLLLFATILEQEQTKAQIREKLLLFRTQLDDSNSNENIERSS